MLISQSDLPRIRFALAQIAQLEVTMGWHRFQRCLHMAAMFHSSSFFMPSPPSFVGRERSSHATFAPPVPSWGPFQRNCLRICSTCLMTAFGSMKRPFQKDWMPQRTDFISWRRPAKDRNLAVQLETLDVIRSTSGLQFRAVSFVEMRGTPR